MSMSKRQIVALAMEKAKRRFAKLREFFCPDSSMVKKTMVQEEADELRQLAGGRNEDEAAASRHAARILERYFMRYAV